MTIPNDDTHFSHHHPYDPRWTEIAFTSSSGRDALGIETHGETILSHLLPGINNQTSRARYYSVWAWALRDFIEDENARHTQQGFYEWVRSREDMLILAYLAHGHGSGIAGTIAGNKVWEDGSHSVYPLTWQSMQTAKGGAYERYYRGPLAEMNITLPEGEERRHDALARPLGLRLADAYGEAVANTLYVKRYLHATQVTRDIIEDFAEKGCLCRVSHYEKERRALIDAFFRFDIPDALAVRRLASLSLFLDIIAQSQGEPLHSDAFRDVMYFWSYGSSHSYQPQGNLIEPAQGWRFFQLRQWFVFAVEAPWSLFLRRIEIEALSEGVYLAELLEQIDLKALEQELGIEFPKSDIHALSLAEFYAAVRQALPANGQEPGPVNLKGPVNERHLGDQIRNKSNHSDPQIMVGYALVMLAIMYWRAQSWMGQPGWELLTVKHAMGRLPMDRYFQHVERAMEEGWSLAEWVIWLHHRYLWQQHRRVVLQKLAGGGKDTSKFEYIDAPEQVDYRTARMRAIGQDYPKMNAPRFPSTLQIMEDLALIEAAPDGGYRLLSDAQTLLDRFACYQIPSPQPEGPNETA